MWVDVDLRGRVFAECREPEDDERTRPRRGVVGLAPFIDGATANETGHWLRPFSDVVPVQRGHLLQLG